MARIRIGRGLLGLAVVALLGACVATKAPNGPEVAVGEVEAPDVFQARESAFWDGRPSLSGVWIASPDADGPKQVVIANLANGRSVKGALFRRERPSPDGPRLLLSEEAAEALRVRTDKPVEVRVVALRDVGAPGVQEPAVSETAPNGARQIQIGVFAKKQNADRVVQTLTKIGIDVRVTDTNKIGQRVWVVTAAGDQAQLQKIKAAGYTDAFFQR